MRALLSHMAGRTSNPMESTAFQYSRLQQDDAMADTVKCKGTLYVYNTRRDTPTLKFIHDSLLT